MLGSWGINSYQCSVCAYCHWNFLSRRWLGWLWSWWWKSSFLHFFGWQFCSEFRIREWWKGWFLHLDVFTFTTSFKCRWQQQFNVGDMALVGKYYQKWGRSKFTYTLLKDFQTTYIHECHIRAIKFSMAPTNHKVQGNDLVYKLPKHVKDGIMQAITTIEF